MRQARCWCWGAGVDSTAGIIADVLDGLPIDLITFADHGAEKRYPDPAAGEEIGTYQFIPVFSAWLRGKGYPSPVLCTYRPKPKTHARYAAAAREVVQNLHLTTVTEEDIQRLSGIFGNMVANETLPGLAFGMKSCSVKWKLEAQEPT